jgi:hypothetical protein
MASEANEVRIAENQATFREANERIELSAEKMQLYGRPVPFVCECPRERCTEIMRMTLEEYEGVRADPTRFATVPGHEDVSVESGVSRVLDRLGEYVVLEKIGVAGQVAKERAGELPEEEDEQREA